MLISHSKKFIFIHNYKVAGSSIRDTLGMYSASSFKEPVGLDKLKYKLGIYPKIYSDQFHGHIRASELKDKLPKKIFESYYKFGFVRNPWDWQVSLYTYALNFKPHHQHELFKKMKNFDEYIDWRINEEMRFQKDFFYNDAGECLVNCIGKFETLDEDFLKICNTLKIDSQLSFLNKSERKPDYLKYYSQQTIDKVYEAFYSDITLFGYTRPELK